MFFVKSLLKLTVFDVSILQGHEMIIQKYGIQSYYYYDTYNYICNEHVYSTLSLYEIVK